MTGAIHDTERWWSRVQGYLWYLLFFFFFPLLVYDAIAISYICVISARSIWSSLFV